MNINAKLDSIRMELWEAQSAISKSVDEMLKTHLEKIHEGFQTLKNASNNPSWSEVARRRNDQNHGNNSEATADEGTERAIQELKYIHKIQFNVVIRRIPEDDNVMNTIRGLFEQMDMEKPSNHRITVLCYACRLGKNSSNSPRPIGLTLPPNLKSQVI